MKNKGMDCSAQDYEELVRYGSVRMLEFLKAEERTDSTQNLMELLSGSKETMNSEELLVLLKQKYMDSIQNGEFLPFGYLIHQFHLSDLEIECMVLSLLPELEERFAYIYQKMSSSEFLTIGLFVRIERFSKSESYAFCRNYMNLEFFQVAFEYEATKPLCFRQLRLSQRILNFIFGQIYEDTVLEEYIERIGYDKQSQGIIQIHSFCKQILRYESESDRNVNYVFYLYGAKGSGKRVNLREYAIAKKQDFVILHTAKMLNTAKREEILERYQNELSLTSSRPCIDVTGLEKNEREFIIHWMLNKHKNVFVIEESETGGVIDENGFCLVELPCNLPNERQKYQIWSEYAHFYPLEEGITISEFADRFPFTPGIAQRVFEEAHKAALQRGEKVITKEQLLYCCRKQVEVSMSDKMQKIECHYRWEDLILPRTKKEMLLTACRQVCSHYQVFIEWGFGQKISYGSGISMLFYGAPGTGKTMAAQVIANELGMELYRVDLACIVSKFVGETEKNLKEIFDCAKKTKNVLFFDEADVLFGKRTEVKDATDKYSNMEAAYLLQKMEEYEGICILATNYLQNIDDAFRRRLKFIIEFPLPEIQQRMEVWKNVYPSKVPLQKEIDYSYLAETFELSPSSIKNIALYSAYLASWMRESVGMYHIIQGIKNEMKKSGKNLLKQEFGEYSMYYDERL